MNFRNGLFHWLKNIRVLSVCNAFTLNTCFGFTLDICVQRKVVSYSQLPINFVNNAHYWIVIIYSFAKLENYILQNIFKVHKDLLSL